MTIDSFSGNYEFLSNFFVGEDGSTVEHMYQASKTLDLGWRTAILNTLTPGKAKRLGQKAPLRKDWEKIKIQVMSDLVREKFKDLTLKTKLIDTFPTKLIEGNRWHDNFWGSCSCDKCFKKDKHNVLGNILMQIRGELMAEVFKK
jgi:hypothetical protein